MATKTRSERETIIRRAADETKWEVFSEDPRVIRKLEGLYGPGRQDHQSAEGLVWDLPATGVSFRKPRKMTEAQRKEAAARLAEVRKG